MENRFEWMRRHFSRIIVWLVFVITYIVMIIVSALIHMTYSEITFARPLAENMEWVLCFVVPTILLFILFDRYTLFIVNISNRIYKSRLGFRFRVAGLFSFGISALTLLTDVLSGQEYIMHYIYMILFGIHLAYRGFTLPRVYADNEYVDTEIGECNEQD